MVSGISADSQEVYFYQVVEPSRVLHRGPEVISRFFLEPNLKISVSGFWECDNCFLGGYTLVGLDLPLGNYGGKPVYMPLHIFYDLVDREKLVVDS